MDAIMLNIKCSKVRRWYKTMEVVLATTSALAVIVVIAAMMATVSIASIMHEIGTLFLAIGIVGIIACAALFLSWSLVNIYSALPAMKCIEAEEPE